MMNSGDKFTGAFLCGYSEAVEDITRQLQIVREKTGRDTIDIDDAVTMARSFATTERIMALSNREDMHMLERKLKAGWF